MLLTLNFFNVLRIIFAFLFQILFIRYFGAGLETDVYYTAIGTLQFINLITYSLLVDLYTPVFHEINESNPVSANALTNSVILLALVVSTCLAILCFFCPLIISKIFASGFSKEKHELLRSFLTIWAITIITNLLSAVFIEHLNANMLLRFSYIVNLVIPTINLLGLCIFKNDYGYTTIVYSHLIGSLLTFTIIFIYFLRHHTFAWVNPLKNKDTIKLIRKNFPVYLAQSVNNLASIISINILSFFPSGYITIYKYITAIFGHISSVINSPISRVLYSKTSKFLAEKRITELNNLIYNTISSNTVLLAIALMINILFFDIIYTLIFSSKVTADQIEIMYYLFLLHTPLTIISSVEMPFNRITFALQKGVKILIVYSSFLLAYLFFISISIWSLGIYALILSRLFGKVFTTFHYMKTVYESVKFSYTQVFATASYLFCIILLTTASKHALVYYTCYNVYWGVLLMILFMCCIYKETYRSILFFTGNHLNIK